MATYIPFLTDGQIRFFLLSNRVIQWLSSVVVLGINSYLINKGPRGLFITYLEVVVSERTSKETHILTHKMSGRCFCRCIPTCFRGTFPEQPLQRLCLIHRCGIFISVSEKTSPWFWISLSSRSSDGLRLSPSPRSITIKITVILTLHLELYAPRNGLLRLLCFSHCEYSRYPISCMCLLQSIVSSLSSRSSLKLFHCGKKERIKEETTLRRKFTTPA